MKTRRQTPAARRSRGHPVAALLAAARARGRRTRNLAELAALDANRLEDIGLTRAARARMLGPR